MTSQFFGANGARADPKWYRQSARPSLRVFILQELNAVVGAVWVTRLSRIRPCPLNGWMMAVDSISGSTGWREHHTPCSWCLLYKPHSSKLRIVHTVTDVCYRPACLCLRVVHSRLGQSHINQSIRRSQCPAGSIATALSNVRH